MFKSYLTVAVRTLTANKLFSLINILGLAAGLVVCLFIALFVSYELGYDTHLKDIERTYRVERDFLDGKNVSLALATTAPPIGPLLASEFSEIESFTRVARESISVTIGNNRFIETDFGLADGNMLEFFGIHLIRGEDKTALGSPNSLILSESTVERYFPNQDPMGKTVLLSGTHPIKVTGIFSDFPKNTHMKLGAIGSIKITTSLFGEGVLENWGANAYHTYIKLPKGYDSRKLENKFTSFLSKHLSENANEWTRLSLRAMTDIHLYSNKEMEFSANGSIGVVFMFSAIAFCVLVIACINFMNLSTARSILRAKEVGVRKTLGSSRRELIVQFLFESVFLTTISMIIAIAFVEWLLPDFSNLVERDLRISVLADIKGIIVIFLGTIFVGVLAGSYPAFYLSKFSPVNVLSGKTSGSKSAIFVRKMLVVFQFTVSITLIIATLVVNSQMEYARNKDLGYSGTHNLVSSVPRNISLWESYLPFKEALLRNPMIESVTVSTRVPTDDLLDGSGYIASNKAAVDANMRDLRDVRVGYDFFDHYEIALLAGRFLSEEFQDRNAVWSTEEKPHGNGNIMLSRSAADKLGFSNPSDAIGKIVIQPFSQDYTVTMNWKVVGVVEDIHFSSLYSEKGSIVYTPISQGNQRIISIKYKSAAIKDVIRTVDAAWSQVVPDLALSHEFLENRFDAIYKDEQRQGIVFAVFSILAVFVAILGLFGLVSFSVERRSKEIAIRKVIGAKVKDIVTLLTADFSKLILVSNLIAWPLAYFSMKQWLAKFAYAVPLDFMIFLFSSVLVLLVALAILSLQTAYVARSRPVHALRYE